MVSKKLRKVMHRSLAVATSAMYDMSRSITKGYQDSYTEEQRNKIKNVLTFIEINPQNLS